MFFIYPITTRDVGMVLMQEMKVPWRRDRWKSEPPGPGLLQRLRCRRACRWSTSGGGGAAQHWCEHGPGCLTGHTTRPTHLAGPCDLHPAGTTEACTPDYLESLQPLVMPHLSPNPQSELPLGNRGLPTLDKRISLDGGRDRALSGEILVRTLPPSDRCSVTEL